MSVGFFNFKMVFALLFLCLGECAILGAQQSVKPRTESNATVSGVTGSATTSPELPNTYRIGPGDVLHISVWREDALTQNAVVRTDGKISLPLVSEVAVAGKTPLSVQQMLAERYSDFIAHPEITVTVTEVNSQIVYILGEVQKPGAYSFVQSIGPLQLIARAGGLTPYAKKSNVYLLRGSDHKRVPLKLDKLLKGDGPTAELLLMAGDTVVVP